MSKGEIKKQQENADARFREYIHLCFHWGSRDPRTIKAHLSWQESEQVITKRIEGKNNA